MNRTEPAPGQPLRLCVNDAVSAFTIDDSNIVVLADELNYIQHSCQTEPEKVPIFGTVVVPNVENRFSEA